MNQLWHETGGMAQLGVILLMVSSVLVSDRESWAEKQQVSEPLVLEVSLWHTLTGERVTQAIDVEENAAFHIVTTTGKTRWTVAGSLGQLVNGEAPITLSIEWYVNTQSHENMTIPLTLRLGEEGQGVGVIHGVVVTPLLRRRESNSSTSVPTIEMPLSEQNSETSH